MTWFNRQISLIHTKFIFMFILVLFQITSLNAGVILYRPAYENTLGSKYWKINELNFEYSIDNIAYSRPISFVESVIRQDIGGIQYYKNDIRLVEPLLVNSIDQNGSLIELEIINNTLNHFSLNTSSDEYPITQLTNKYDNTRIYLDSKLIDSSSLETINHTIGYQVLTNLLLMTNTAIYENGTEINLYFDDDYFSNSFTVNDTYNDQVSNGITPLTVYGTVYNISDRFYSYERVQVKCPIITDDEIVQCQSIDEYIVVFREYGQYELVTGLLDSYQYFAKDSHYLDDSIIEWNIMYNVSKYNNTKENDFGDISFDFGFDLYILTSSLIVLIIIISYVILKVGRKSTTRVRR